MGIAVPDNGFALSNCPEVGIVVSGVPGTQLGVDVTLRSIDLIVTGTFTADIRAALTSPDGTVTTLLFGPPTGVGGFFGGSDGYGNNASCPNPPLFRLEDGAPPMTNTANPAGVPITGTFSPFQPLAPLNNGSDSNGTWTLELCDDAGGDLHTLQFVRLNFFNCDPRGGPLREQCGLPGRHLHHRRGCHRPG